MATDLALVPQQQEAADLTAIERVVIAGDLSKLTPDERWNYYRGVCQSLGLNPFTKPFDYINLSGKLTLYAKKDCGDQLRKIHGVSIDITARERIDDLYVVTARATTRQGRHDEEIGAVTIGNLRGDALANALMKATTKAKRRVTLSICGLGMLDETELETIASARPANVETIPQDALPSPSNSAAAATNDDERQCDAGHYNRLWHATVKDTRFAEDAARHQFMDWYTDGACASLSEWLAEATVADADALIATIRQYIDQEARKASEQPEYAF